MLSGTWPTPSPPPIPTAVMELFPHILHEDIRPGDLHHPCTSSSPARSSNAHHPPTKTGAGGLPVFRSTFSARGTGIGYTLGADGQPDTYTGGKYGVTYDMSQPPPLPCRNPRCVGTVEQNHWSAHCPRRNGDW